MSEVIATGHWEVSRAKNAGQKDNPHGGQLDKWYIGLKNLDGGKDCDDAYWQRKAPSEVTVGDKVYGRLEKGSYGLRFYVEKEPDGGGGIEAKAGGGWKPESQYDPEKTARITRSHAQQMALRWAALQPDAENLTLPKIFQFADAFERDVGQAASSAQGVAAPRQEGTVPSVSAPPESSSSPASPSLEELEQALDTAGLIGPAVGQVAAYMAAHLEPERQVNAVRKLVDAADLETQASALAKLKVLTEKWQGKPLAVSTADDSLPF